VRTVGAYEAKTHLSQLLDEVARGETITITRHGVPVAELMPPRKIQQRDVSAAIEDLRKLREKIGSLEGLSIREMIEEGRS
jgi:prevent-host-death family protein